LSDTAATDLETRIRRRTIYTNGVELFAVEAGPDDGPLVVLLHGFPEYWYGWRHQILPLAAAGYRVLVPDQRGYHISDKPTRIRDYKLDVLARDVVGLIDDAGRDDAVVVGHDWGGVVGWWLAMTRPDRVRSLVAINAPHPQAMRAALRSDAMQRRRSRYFLLFQLPILPERRLSRDHFAAMRDALVGSARPGTFSETDLDRYREAWAAPGALTGMLNWYRAMRFPRQATKAKVAAPTLLIWGTDDQFLGAALVDPSVARCAEGIALRIPGATHWVHHEEPDTVNAAILDFLRPQN
jgi:pimeloyl-ACP methyl ester carboxylesterase